MKRVSVPFLALCLLCLFRLGPAQTSPVTQPPPQIQFPEWKEIPSEEGISEFTETFPSAVVTKYPENNVVPIRVLMPAVRDHPIPVVIVLHYWGATDLGIERELGRKLTQNGIGAVLLTLPYHLSRAPKGHRSGELMVVPNTAQLIESMRQSVLDVRRAVDFIETKSEFDHDKIGITGTSLGSLVSELTFAVDERFKAAGFMVGGVDLAHILWHSSKVVSERDVLRRQGYTEARLRTELATIEPLTYLAGRLPEKTYVIGAKYDTVIPPEDTAKLIHVLPNPKVMILPTGHTGGFLDQAKITNTMVDFFASTFGTSGTTFLPPKHLYIPTVRFEAQFDPINSLQIGAGIDLLRSNTHSDFFASVFATPKGPELFAGANLTRGFSLGAFATLKHVTFGLMWSTVL